MRPLWPQPAAAAALALPGGAGAGALAAAQLLLAVALLAGWAPTALASAAALLKAGDTAFGSGDYSAAVRHYTGALELDPSTPLFYTKRAAAYASLKKYPAAFRDLDAAVTADENFTAGYLSRGRLHRQVCSLDDARTDFERVLQIKPGHSSAPRELLALGELEQAMRDLERAAGGPGGGGGGGGGGGLDVAAGQALLDRVYASAPDCVPAQLLEAQLQLAQRRYEEVIAVTGRIVKSQPDHLQALTMRGQAYMYTGDHDMAKRHFGEALKYDPDHRESRASFNRLKDLDRKRQRAARALEAQELDEAEQGFLAALQVDPQHSLVNRELHLSLCRVRQALGRPEEAVESCEAALSVDGDFPAASKELVRALLAAKQWERAVDVARNAVQQHQRDGEMHQLYQEAEKRLKMAKRKNYYAILGVTETATTREVKKAYKLLAVRYHPDKVHSSGDKAESEDKFREIAEAYEVLSDEDRRAAYDRGDDLEQGGGGGPWGHPQWGGGHPHFHQQQHFTFHFG